MSPTRYVPPAGRMDRWFGAAVRWLTAHGVSLMGSRVLVVRGRTTGEPRSVPVNLLDSTASATSSPPAATPSGCATCARRAPPSCAWARGREDVRLTEVPVEDRVPVLRVYLKRWGWEVGRFVEGLTKDSTDTEVAAVAPGMPVFRVTAA